MPLSTSLDWQTLNYWSWLRTYAKNKDRFVEVGKIVYQALSHGAKPNGPHEVEQPLALALQATNLFIITCAAKAHAKNALYPTFALSLARHILDNDWVTITSP